LRGSASGLVRRPPGPIHSDTRMASGRRPLAHSGVGSRRLLAEDARPALGGPRRCRLRPSAVTSWESRALGSSAAPGAWVTVASCRARPQAPGRARHVAEQGEHRPGAAAAERSGPAATRPGPASPRGRVRRPLVHPAPPQRGRPRAPSLAPSDPIASTSRRLQGRVGRGETFTLKIFMGRAQGGLAKSLVCFLFSFSPKE
jgi:hypothetical protein